MPKVLTVNSKVNCDHPTPGGGGAVALQAGQDVLTIKGVAVVLSSIAGSIDPANCSLTNKNAGEKQCATATSQIAGDSTVLQVNGTPVTLDTAAGVTDGVGAPPTWSVKSAEQDVLNAD